MITAAFIGSLTLVLGFGILLWKLPKRIRQWLLARNFALDLAFTVFTIGIILPFATGVTSLFTISFAALLWSVGIFGMRRISSFGRPRLEGAHA